MYKSDDNTQSYRCTCPKCRMKDNQKVQSYTEQTYENIYQACDSIYQSKPSVIKDACCKPYAPKSIQAEQSYRFKSRCRCSRCCSGRNKRCYVCYCYKI